MTTDGTPITKPKLEQHLERLGAELGMTLIVHSSLSSIGWVAGGAPTIVEALLDAIGDSGTLVMPSATPQCVELPVFNPETTPTTMGAIAEAFRTWPGTLRSDHPLESVCAHGPAAKHITQSHPLAFSEGPGTPFGVLHNMEAWILLLGVGFNRCTALHYAESLAQNRRTTTNRFPIVRKGRLTWVEERNVADDNDTHFPVIGEEFVATKAVGRGHVGKAKSYLFPMQDLVKHAATYFARVL